MKIHIDFDSFYASCEAARRGLDAEPIAVCGGEEHAAMVIAASYSAKAFGVRTAQRVAKARALCPQLVCLRANLPYYQAVSARAEEFFAAQIPVLERYSVDEFFGDLAGFVRGEAAVREFCTQLQRRTREEFNLPLSIGASISKWSAKLLTTLAKPYGVMVCEDILPALKGVPIGKFAGIGPVLERKLLAFGVRTLDEALARPELFADKAQRAVYARIAGTDNEPVEQNLTAKSLGVSRAFSATSDRAELEKIAKMMADELCSLLLARGTCARAVVLSWRGKGGAKSLKFHIQDASDYRHLRAAAAHLVGLCAPFCPVFSLGISASELEGGDLTRGLKFGADGRNYGLEDEIIMQDINNLAKELPQNDNKLIKSIINSTKYNKNSARYSNNLKEYKKKSYTLAHEDSQEYQDFNDDECAFECENIDICYDEYPEIDVDDV